MSLAKIALLVYLGLTTLLVVGSIGRRRAPISPSTAVGTVVELAILAWLVVIA